MKTFNTVMVTVVSYFFILLFVYAAASKMMDFENFQVQLAQSPLLSAYAGFISYAVIIIEVMIAGVLADPKVRRIGLYASFGLMVAFTVYIFLILKYSDFIPCSCGGILEKMGWTEHLIFNLGCIVVAAIAIIAAYPITPKAYIMYVTEEYWMANYWQRRSDRRMLGFKMVIFLIVPSGLMVALFLSSEHIIKKENNFTRRFLLHPIIEKRSYKLDNNKYYFAGFDNSSIFLGNRKYPLSFTRIDTAFSQHKLIYLKPDKPQYKFKNITIKVSSPYYYIYDGTVPVILRGKIENGTAETISFQDAYFNQLAVIDSSKFILRTQSAATKNFLLGRLDLDAEQKLQLYPEILQKQVDGVFDIDGHLLVDECNKNVVYVYSYRNQFIVMNKEMLVHSKLNTIDTITTAQIKIIELSNGTHQMSKPPLEVNKNADVYGGLLFNHSLLMGKFESKDEWRKADVIDVYRTDSQNYIGSFYIYKKKDQMLNSFMSTDSYFYVIQDDNLIQYKITQQISKYFR